MTDDALEALRRAGEALYRRSLTRDEALVLWLKWQALIAAALDEPAAGRRKQ